MYRKNVAGQFIHFQGVDSATGGIKSGVTWTIRRCIDGTFAAGGGTVTEDGTAGWYKYAMSQADTNGNNIGFNFTGTGAVPQTVNIITTACDPTSTAFGLSIAKTTNITGFNDITAAAAAAGVWQDTTAGDFTVALSVGKSVMNGVSLGTGLTIASVSGSVGSVTGLTASNLDTTVSSRLASASYTAPDNTRPTNFTSMSIDTGGNIAVQNTFKKNVARANFMFLMTDSSTHAPKTGLTVSCTRSIDGAAFGAGAIANITELSNGWYRCDFAASDLNGNIIAFRATATGADDRDLTIPTTP